jgi:large subunit ribosomal protein L5
MQRPVGNRALRKTTMAAVILKEKYNQSIVPELMKEHGYRNVHQVPKVVKIVINHGFDADVDKGGVEEAVKTFARISGQQPVITRAKKSISNFKLREDMPIGVKVTLRGGRMYDFLYRLVAIALPGIRDFRGVPTKLDGKGNYTLGINDHSIFPEITGEHKTTYGMDITLVTSAATDEEGTALLKKFGMPFRKKSGSN